MDIYIQVTKSVQSQNCLDLYSGKELNIEWYRTTNNTFTIREWTILYFFEYVHFDLRFHKKKYKCDYCDLTLAIYSELFIHKHIQHYATWSVSLYYNSCSSSDIGTNQCWSMRDKSLVQVIYMGLWWGSNSHPTSIYINNTYINPAEYT